MKTKEEILENNELGDLCSIASALGWDFDNFKQCIHGAMEEWGKQEAFGFAKWCNNSCWSKGTPLEKLYEHYIQSKLPPP